MRKRMLVLMSLVLILSAFLAACGNDKGGSDKSSSQNLRLNIVSEPPTLHPALATDSTSGGVLIQTFEGLTRIDKDGVPQPAMAEDIQVSDDQLTYTFKIREDATWTNGDPVTAEDFEYAWKWAIDPQNQSQYAYQLYSIKGAEAANNGEGSLDDVAVKVVNEKTLEVTLVNPTPYFLQLLAFYTYFPVNKNVAEANPDWYKDAGDDYVTNGPFKMTEWNHSESILLEKNEDYWDADTVKLETVEMSMVEEPTTELSMFDNDELDWAGLPFGALPTDSIKALKDNGDLNVKAIAGTYWYKFNTEEKPFNNENIRKALTYAIDRKAIVEQITQGGQIPAMAVVPPTMFSENEKGYFKDNDIEAAKAALEKGLKEEGYASVKDLPKITLSYNTSEAHAKIAQAVQDMWKKNLGIDVELDNEEWQVYLEKIDSGDYQIGRMSWSGDYNDAFNFLELYRDANGGNNDTGWENPEYKELLIASQKETDEAKRKQLLQDAEAILMNELPIAPVYFYTNTWVQKENLKDVVISGLGEAQLKWAHFE
ncbi:peptide ABC transporter substrate-binding protein [Cytobacillus oceanisediminis]|jgi:oligopeptide transport system substrate-binding protein|uniref:Peptide ABC transporter substrate-binding protein n=2 Tax=Niallia TaxID=2837506 RepID=A0A941JLS3_NIACI|nr:MULTISPECIES: peptide ABC transporter substrate-binding protein [Bacillaceae]EOR21946.1 oligopeptide ABC transporter oligopeptide-binding protein OppA [Niallia nealsonii AAU1]MBQ6448606.1 peptide ABC transporter substrate-binding protein [Bacillus sp. (in: firmicutes)]MDU1845425.1 peptide ABC transporter substrate-binding protein [Niallia nealsonii]MBZ9532912.1 peptide ABC transporter substrate-binding protein [Cytobacillus oceanisediminis]MCB5236741.1 peptide ABC transporter substrate-bind